MAVLATVPVAALLAPLVTEAAPGVKTLRVPGGGIQPQVVADGAGTVHLIYFRGPPASGDVYYVRSRDGGETFGPPLRVNHQKGSAVAVGNIRGPQVAVGKNGRVHVAWNGSGKARPRGLPNPKLPEDSPYRLSAPMLYTRLNDEGTAFEPERNLMSSTYALDGGGSVAADAAGNVYVIWHAPAAGGPGGEAGRAVWVARSTDEGRTFAAEMRANRKPTGACGCCGLRCFADSRGHLYVLYRSATDMLNRDMYLLGSRNRGGEFGAVRLDTWRVPKCVMSSAALVESPGGDVLAAWETRGQVRFARLRRDRLEASPVVAPPGRHGGGRRFPALSAGPGGRVLLAWTEGMAWNRGGSVAWQVFDARGKALAQLSGRTDGVPAWSLVAVFSRPDGGFTVLY